MRRTWACYLGKGEFDQLYPFTPLEQRGAAVMMSDWVELRYEEEHHQEMDHVLSGSRFGVG